MELGVATIPRVGINTLRDALHPIYGLVWTDGHDVFIIPINNGAKTFDTSSSKRLGTFQYVHGIRWFRNSSLEAVCLLCVELDSVVAIWTGEGKQPDVHFKQVATVSIKTILNGCLWNPKVDILCLLSSSECVFYLNRFQTTTVPFILPLDYRTNVSCGAWSKDGSVLTIGAGTYILVYSWCDINGALSNYRFLSFSLAGVTGPLCSIGYLKGSQFLCTTELPLDQLCTQNESDTSVLPKEDDTLMSETPVLNDESDDFEDRIIQPRFSGCNSLLEQLLQLPRADMVPLVDSSHLVLFEVESVTLEIRKLSSISVSGILSPDILHVCDDSGFVYIGSNTSNVVSRFKIGSDYLAYDSIVKLSADERLKGLGVFPSMETSENELIMMTGQLSATDQIFPPTSNLVEYQIRLHKDFQQKFESLKIDDCALQVFCRNHEETLESHRTRFQSSDIGHFGNWGKSLSSGNQRFVHNNKGLKAAAYKKGTTSDALGDKVKDTLKHDNLQMPTIGYSFPKKSIVEVHEASDNEIKVSLDAVVLDNETRCSNCVSGQMLKILKHINLKLQIQEKQMADLISTIEIMHQHSTACNFQPSSNPEVIRVIFKQPSRDDVQKLFILDNHRLKLDAIKQAFNLTSVELFVDDEPCVLSAGTDGFIPLTFTPNETIFITG